MLIIRLQRVGRTNDPSFRVVVVDSKRSAKTGSVLEVVGNYNARQGKPEFQVERIQHWIKSGAQVSETVHNLLVKNKIIDGQTVNTVPKKPAQVVAEVLAEEVKLEEKAAETAETEVVPVETPATEEASEPVAETPVA